LTAHRWCPAFRAGFDERRFRSNTEEMDFDGSTLIAGLFGSGVGFVLFSYGKKMNRFPHLAIGLVLLVAPYFLPGALSILLVTSGLVGLLWLGVRLGY
jgi:hypothetical protein